jgi:hypothetical protein
VRTGYGNTVIILTAVIFTSTITGINIIILCIYAVVVGTITAVLVILKRRSTGATACRITYKIDVV